MTRCILIAAMADSRLIGQNGKLPWNNPEDLANFKRLTTGGVIVMGRKTFESIGRPLPNRRNIVLSTQEIQREGIEVVSSVESMIQNLQQEGIDRVFIIGGQKVYTEFLNRDLIDEIWLSKIAGEFEGDAFLDHFEEDFREIEIQQFETFRFITYVKKSR